MPDRRFHQQKRYAQLVGILAALTLATPVFASVAPSVIAEKSPLPSKSWQVSPADGTLRDVIAKWAKAEGWSFSNTNWTPAIDIPVIANASFQGSFVQAVQDLVSTTELTEAPLQPCFYSNKVVRVVYFNESCDKMSAR